MITALTLTNALSFRELLAVTVIPCAAKGVDPNLWFGDSTDDEEKYDNEDAAKAVALCQTCPIRNQCLQDAISTNEYWGVRGATTPAQRDRLRQQGRR